MEDLKALALFWQRVSDWDRLPLFSDEILKKLFILQCSKLDIWKQVTSVYFLKNRDDDNNLDVGRFGAFLDKITAFIFAHIVIHPGAISLRGPIYHEMITIINGQEVTFSEYRFDESQARTSFENFSFSNLRPITRALLTWYAYTFPKQERLSYSGKFSVEHIYSKNRQKSESQNIESLGNKVLLERSINSRASNHSFEDKKQIYRGEFRHGRNKEPSKIYEIREKICEMDEFDEQQIINRKKAILDRFFKFLSDRNLLK